MLSLDSSTWCTVLENGLGAQTEFLEYGGRRALCATLNAGPFRVLYPDFPVGMDDYPKDLCAAILQHARERNVDLVRFHSRTTVPVSCREVARQCSPVIPVLADWIEIPPEKARRARNRKVRSALHIGPGEKRDASMLQRLYADTVARHRGNMRYSEEYFAQIAEATTLVAKLEGRVCGFVAFAARGDCGFYLHGAHDPVSREHHPSDQLFLEMLTQSARAGLRRFDFLPSPAGQSGLGRYKAAWGGEPSELIVSDVHLNPVRAGLFKAAKWLVDRMNSHARKG